jgi:hypothetical protein
VRPCPTCQCFVPVAASYCPRCDAALEPIEVPEADDAARDDGDRDLVLVGAGRLAAALTGSQTLGDPITRSVVARVALPPLEGPAGLPRRPTLPKLPQPFAPDPLVLAVFLGIPLRTQLPVASPAPPPPAPAPPAPSPPAPAAPVEAEATPVLSADAFAVLLGTPTTKPVAHRPARDLLPVVHDAALVAVPVTATRGAGAPLQPHLRPRRFARGDPFASRTTRRERILTRTCMFLVMTLALAVVALRLPIGARPQLDASSASVGVSVVSVPDTPTTTPFAEIIRVQTRVDLRVVVATTARVYPVWSSYAPATPVVLSRALPQFGFVTGTHVSRRVGEMSVAASAHEIVLAEYAGPGECAYARVVDRHTAETAPGPTGTPCRASAAPAHGWTPLGHEG